MSMKLLLGIGVSACLMLAGCASVRMASKDADAKAKSFAPAASDNANLYIYRNESMGGAVKLPLLLDGTSIGDTGPHTYVFKTISLGKHTITSKSEKDVTLDIDAAPGQTYFVWQEVKMGIMAARSALHLEDAPVAEKAILDCKLIE